MRALAIGASLVLSILPTRSFAAAPAVTISSPANGTILTAPASFTIRASVAGGGNNVAQVEFFVGALSVAVDTDNPYRADVNDLAAGTYTLSTVLTDNSNNKSSNSVTIVVNALPTVVITEPADGSGLIAPATFQLRATAADSDGAVASIAFARGTTALGTATTNPAAASIRNLGVGNYRFTATATDNLGGTGTTNIDLIVKTRPTVSLATPANGARLTAVTNTFTGSAADTHGVASVEYSLNGGAFQPANGTLQWTIPLVLPPGTNVVRVRALDDFGNSSLTNSRSVFQVVPAALALATNGSGGITGLTNGQILDVNRGYTITALPAAGHVFSNWTGTVTSSLPKLNFLMQSNTTVIANFVTNPFVQVSGAFNGIFHETNETQHGSSGEFNFRLTTSGKFTAALRLAGIRYRAIGNLSLDGHATTVIPRTGLAPLNIAWTVDLHGLDQITGSVSDGQWTAALLGDRAVFNATNASPWMARHTLTVQPAVDVSSPSGAGWGTLRIAANGLGTLAGSLPDGTRLSRKAPLSKNGDWPLYAALYKLRGSTVGWIHFDTNAPLDDLRGAIDWFRLSQLGVPLYPFGFTNQTTFSGSRYLAPSTATNRILELPTGAISFSNGNLTQNLTNTFTLGTNNRVTNTGPTTMTVSLARNSGLFKGTFLHPDLNRTIPFTGALLQKSTNGAGYFLGTNQGGRVTLEGRP